MIDFKYEMFLRVKNINGRLLPVRLIFIYFFLFIVPVVAFTQNNGLNLNMQNVTVDKVLSAIEKSSDYRFFFQHEQIDIGRHVSIDVKNAKIEKVLDDLFKNQKITYTILGNNLILLTKKDDSPLSQKQNKIIVSGTVVDEKNEPIPGVYVLEVGANNGTVTDIDGRYSISLDSEDTQLKFSFLGYKTQTVGVGNKRIINITMFPDMNTLSEVVIIGYGKQSRRKVLGAVSSVKSEDIARLPVSGVDEAITGRISGVQINTPGAPGRASQIKIRGIGTITAGQSPLIVVDGYPMTEGSDINAINPQDIESVEVLKDAASSAIYGSRGANGVILITTKSAKEEKISFNFDGYSGFQQVLNPMNFLDAYQYAQMVKEARDWGYVSADPANRSIEDDNATRLSKGAKPRHLIPSNLDIYLKGTPGLTDNNWLDDIFQNGQLQNYNLSVSGRKGNTKWFVSGAYFDQEGLIIGSGYKRYSAKINLETKLQEKIKMGVNLTPSASVKNSIIEGWTDSPLQQAILSEPFFTPYNNEGKLNISQQIRWHNSQGTDGALVENPVAIALRKKDETNKFRLFGSTFLEMELAKGLRYKSMLGGDFDYSLREEFRPSTIGKYRKDASVTTPWAKEKTKARKNIINENTLDFTKTFKEKHNLNLLAGYSYQREKYESIYVNAPLLNNDYIENVAGASETKTSKDISEWVMISYFGRVQYDFDSKYLFSSSIRRDGSSRFGENSKFGIFPSVSAGWIISNENFFPKKSIVSNLKLRYSWGKTGNNQIGNYAAISLLKPLNGYLDDDLAEGQIPSTSPNADLSWETSITSNFGFDLGLFDNKLRILADYFVAQTKDMLLEVPVPQHSGYSVSLQNIGKMENKGFEFVLTSSNVNLGKIGWTSSFNFSSIKNKVTALAEGQDQIIKGINITKVGSPIGEFYGYVVDGIYKSQEEIENSAQKNTDIKVGDWRIVDINGDGKIDDNDRTVIGSSLPDYTFGFSNNFTYKNLSLNIFIDGVQGIDVFSRTVRNATNGQGFSNQLVWYFENRWHPENNPEGTLARPDYTQSSERLRANVSSAYLQDGSFIRLRNITLSYNLPEAISRKMKTDRVRVYISAKNLMMLTDFKGYNPQQSRSDPLYPSDTQGSYPLNKSYILGINFSF